VEECLTGRSVLAEERVYCVESNDDYVPVIRENARPNGFAGVVQAIHADATTVQLPSQIDVIISTCAASSIPAAGSFR
jgi:tRNA G37 N-methylase Trm5